MTVHTLMRVRFGSHLYGTSTPSSDTDYKSVHVPSARAIMLGTPENHINRGTKIDTKVKNSPDDIDDESFSISKFFDMITKGDTVAIEMLYAPSEMLEVSTPEWEAIRSLRYKLVNRQCKGYVGYCQRQAAKYGIRGSRIAAVRLVIQTLDEALKTMPNKTPMSALAATWYLMRTHEHIDVVDLYNQYGAPIPHLVCCDRKMGWTTSIRFAHNVYSKVLENYGHRALAAEKNEGIDWKAVSHAVRVSRQAIELLSTGNLIFPRPDAQSLLDIKLGRVPYATVQDDLEKTLIDVETASANSPLPEESDLETMQIIVEMLHLEQIRQTYFRT